MEEKQATKAWIDIENAKTKQVITLEMPILKYERMKETIFDVSSLNNKEISLLTDAINRELNYTDIEMFFIDSKPRIPIFGPDFEYKIEDGKLIAKYVRGLSLEERRKI